LDLKIETTLFSGIYQSSNSAKIAIFPLNLARRTEKQSPNLAKRKIKRIQKKKKQRLSLSLGVFSAFIYAFVLLCVFLSVRQFHVLMTEVA
jgi:hypothetical protein